MSLVLTSISSISSIISTIICTSICVHNLLLFFFVVNGISNCLSINFCSCNNSILNLVVWTIINSWLVLIGTFPFLSLSSSFLWILVGVFVSLVLESVLFAQALIVSNNISEVWLDISCQVLLSIFGFLTEWNEVTILISLLV